MTDDLNTTPPVEAPITVNASAAQGQLGQAMRVLLVAIGGYMGGKGWLDAGIATALVPVILIAAPLAWGQWKSRRDHAIKVTFANKLPDSEARVV